MWNHQGVSSEKIRKYAVLISISSMWVIVVEVVFNFEGWVNIGLNRGLLHDVNMGYT